MTHTHTPHTHHTHAHKSNNTDRMGKGATRKDTGGGALSSMGRLVWRQYGISTSRGKDGRKRQVRKGRGWKHRQNT